MWHLGCVPGAWRRGSWHFQVASLHVQSIMDLCPLHTIFSFLISLITVAGGVKRLVAITRRASNRATRTRTRCHTYDIYRRPSPSPDQWSGPDSSSITWSMSQGHGPHGTHSVGLHVELAESSLGRLFSRTTPPRYVMELYSYLVRTFQALKTRPSHASKNTLPRLARPTLNDLQHDQHEKASLLFVHAPAGSSGLALVPCALSAVDLSALFTMLMHTNTDTEQKKTTPYTPRMIRPEDVFFS